jgi:flagellar biosynthesis protein FlhA
MAHEMAVITLNPELEQILQQSVQTAPEAGIGIEPRLAEQMVAELKQCVQRQEAENKAPVLLVSPVLRPALAKLLKTLAPNLHVLAYSEVPDNKQIRVIAAVGGSTPGLKAPA